VQVSENTPSRKFGEWRQLQPLKVGARGNDRLTGRTEADRFEGGSGTDTATDFTASQGDTKDNTVEAF
jgi:Ca2+-binding RTX toxin-like protein